MNLTRLLVLIGGVCLFATFSPSRPETQKHSTVSTENPNTNNCAECIKDHHTKEVRARGTRATTGVESPNSPATIVVSKNNHYVEPPAQLGDGHALNVKLDAPGKILYLQSFACNTSKVCNYQCISGASCEWTHQVEVLRLSDTEWLWVGWSNSGDNCQLSFTIHYL